MRLDPGEDVWVLGGMRHLPEMYGLLKIGAVFNGLNPKSVYGRSYQYVVFLFAGLGGRNAGKGCLQLAACATDDRA